MQKKRAIRASFLAVPLSFSLGIEVICLTHMQGKPEEEVADTTCRQASNIYIQENSGRIACIIQMARLRWPSRCTLEVHVPDILIFNYHKKHNSHSD